VYVYFPFFSVCFCFGNAECWLTFGGLKVCLTLGAVENWPTNDGGNYFWGIADQI
jgi:hypothetical protein